MTRLWGANRHRRMVRPMTPGAGGAKESSMTGLPRREARPRRRAARCDGGFGPGFGCARRLEAKMVQVWAVAEGGAGRLMLRVGAPRLSVARSCSLSLSLSPFRPLPFSPHSCLSPCISPSRCLPVSVPFPHSLFHGAARRAILRGHIAYGGLWLVTALCLPPSLWGGGARVGAPGSPLRASK